MLRSNPATSMQKTYDEVYLVCSTAIYFEQQNNETEALRSWREALDQIYYHNAYKIPANYKPKTETERALQESLRDMELQCKERVDLFDALRKSKEEAKSGSSDSVNSQKLPSRPRVEGLAQGRNDSLGNGTIRPTTYDSLSRPPLPTYRSSQSPRPDEPATRSHSDSMPRSAPPLPNSSATSLKPPQSSAPKPSRSPSPDKRSVFRSTLRPEKKDRNGNPAARLPPTMRSRPGKSAAAAASLAWPGQMPPPQMPIQSPSLGANMPDPGISSRKASVEAAYVRQTADNHLSSKSHPLQSTSRQPGAEFDDHYGAGQPPPLAPGLDEGFLSNGQPHQRRAPPPPPPHRGQPLPATTSDDDAAPGSRTLSAPPPPAFPTYRKEYPAQAPLDARKVAGISRNAPGVERSRPARDRSSSPRKQKPAVPRKAVGSSTRPANSRQASDGEHNVSSGSDVDKIQRRRRAKPQEPEPEPVLAELPADNVDSKDSASAAWDARVKHLMENLPKGVDKDAAKAIFNEIVIKGDEVHWEDVAGLDIAKNALKEAVVYPFLRPDLFMGLREPARGMLLFGPPGTGKTMLARAVATESHSTFFAISASSLTSKYLGESEKLVRALFSLAKALTPSIIFVDEIDSLLSARGGGGGEHEATRRIKTEFLIQWSDLAKAAAGREQGDGDASRVLVLAATNLPWAIDEAARRRFVRRQYIPLPESHVREDQLRRLMSAQKHSMRDDDYMKLVALTDGFSGSDITALAKDAAMGPLRSLGEKLLHMSPEDIRPIGLQDFEHSLVNIRPSVSKQGLKEFEDWATQFGERGG